MLNNGDLQSMWAVARETHLTFNAVRAGGWAGRACCGGGGGGPALPCPARHEWWADRSSSPPRPPSPPLLQVTFVLTCLLLVLVSAAYVFTRSRPVYLLNFRCFKPPSK